MNETMMSIVVSCASFFELADEDLLDSRVALKQLEQMKWELQRLSTEDKAAFASYIAGLATQAERQTGRDRRWQCLMDLPQALGLAGSGQD